MVNPSDPRSDPASTSSVIDRYQQHCQGGAMPDLADFVASGPALKPPELAALVHVDQRHRHAAGATLPAESYFESFPVLRKDTELALDVVYQEYVLRRDAGESYSTDKYLARFPDLAEQLAMQFDLDGAMGDEHSAVSMANTQATVEQSPAYPPGTVIAGRYKLLEEIGEGGMGTVWVAQQTEPVRRRVAIKLIKPGMDSRQVLSRFEAERQALAVMDHPHIAKVLDGGMTDQGRPYFVMEYVKGEPITDYCDQARLSVKDRLKLFVQVCQAVQHAHQKGIIHRDLKPSNVLVCPYDGQPVPKVIDFGLAKAMHQSLTEHSLYTAHGVMVGTPLYMSPEQAETNNLDIDTRSDLYSLGVILYELLTGSTPLEKRRLHDAALQEMLRLIQQEEPPKPSTRLSGSGSLPTIAAQRSLEPAQLSRAVRGDLDWIVMKSLEKERSRRYETANGLARDIERYLHDDPVEARPPSAGYRFGKFARRNRAALVTIGLVAAALVIGTTVSTWQAIRAETARSAEAEQRREADTQRELAEANFKKAKAAVVEKDHALGEKDDALELVKASELLQRRRLYASEMNLAQQSLATRDSARVLDLLENHRPLPGERDLRGFEWYYLWREIHPGLRATFTQEEDGAYGKRAVEPGTNGDHWGLAVSPDGQTVAVGSMVSGGKGRIKLWDGATGKLKATLPTSPRWITCLAYSPDGAILASGSAGGAIRLWNAHDGSQLGQSSNDAGFARSLCFSPDGKQLAVAGDGIVIYDTSSDEPRKGLELQRLETHEVKYSPDGTRIYAGSNWGELGRRTRVYDLTKSPPEMIDELKDTSVADVSPDGRFLACIAGNSVALWDIKNRKAVWQFGAHPGYISDLRFTPDGKSLISAGRSDRMAILWDIATKKEVVRIPHPTAVGSVRCGTQATDVWASLSNDGTVKTWNLDRPAEASTIHPERPNRHMVLMPNGRSVILVGYVFPAKIWDLQTGKQTLDKLPATNIRSVSADGKRMASLDRLKTNGKPTIRVWDMTADRGPHVIELPKAQDGTTSDNICLAPKGQSLASYAQNDNAILIWELTGEPPSVPEPFRIQYLHPSFAGVCLCRHLEFSPDGAWLAAAHEFGVVNLYNLKTKQIVPVPLPSAPWATQVAFSWDGKLLASGNDVGVAGVFDTETAEVIASFPGHEAAISALAFFPDGRTLAVGSRSTIRLWDLPSKQERITLRVGQDGPSTQPVTVEQLATMIDGTTLISRQSDGTVRVWRGGGQATEGVMAVVSTPPQIVQTPNNDPRFLARRAIAHAGLGHWERATADCREAERTGIKWNAALLKMLIQALPANKQSTANSEPHAAKQFREFVTSTAMSIAVESKNAGSLNSMAWQLASSGEAGRSMTTFAVRAAQKAVELAPNDAMNLNTLGVAQYRAGQWEESIASLTKAEELAPDKTLAFNGFFLAMAHWQLGHKEQARKWYDRSVEWMKKNQPKNEELVRFRAETEQLLGIMQPSPTPNDAPQGDDPAKPKS